ncbi:MAG TPA: efflux RND transporter periplasmic adaptor subunit [Bacteroidia bacterium]|nr:efflux RND transporter periplasmic adaptor subunit [Bacteroidia bacterium]
MKKIVIYIVGGCLFFALALSLKSCSGDKAIKVATEKAQYRDIMESVSSDGNIQPTILVKISPDVSGEIIELPVHEGQRVKKGDLLVKIFPDIYKSAYDQAEAAYNSSKSAITNAESQLTSSQGQYDNQKAIYERNQKLFSQGAISQADLDAAKASYQTAAANLKSAQDNIEAAKFNSLSAEATMNEAHENLVKTSIVAPTDGVVVGLTVKQGESVVGTATMAGTVMMSIADLSNMEADVNVNENDIVNVKIGDTALIEVDAFVNRKFKGVVSEVSNSASVSTGATSVDQVTNFLVKIHILASSYTDLMPEGTNDSPFKPGMSTTADIQVKSAKHILSVPIEAVTTRSTKDTLSMMDDDKRKSKSSSSTKTQSSDKKDSIIECVFFYDSKINKVKKVVVTTGVQDADYIQIKTGMKENDEIVIAPYSAVSSILKDGMQVSKVDKSELFTASSSDNK